MENYHLPSSDLVAYKHEQLEPNAFFYTAESTQRFRYILLGQTVVQKLLKKRRFLSLQQSITTPTPPHYIRH